MPWPDLVFGDDRVTQALGGAAPSAYLAGCDPDCFWLPADPDPDDVWWILLGTNERAHDPDATAESYHQNMLGVISRIPSHDIRLLSSPYTWDYLWLDRSEERAFLDEQAMVDQLICQELAHVTCVADLRPLLRAELHYLGDRVHFNQAGHAAIAEYLLVPEPGSLILCAWGVLMLARMPRRRR